MIKLGEEVTTKENEDYRVSVKLIGYVPEGYVVKLTHYEKSINKEFSYTNTLSNIYKCRLNSMRDSFKRIPGLKNYYCIGTDIITNSSKSIDYIYNKWRMLIEHDLVPDDTFMIYSNFKKWYLKQCEKIEYNNSRKPIPYIFSDTELNKQTCIVVPFKYGLSFREIKENNDNGYIIMGKTYRRKYRVHLYRNSNKIHCYTKKFASNLFYFKKYMNLLEIIKKIKNDYEIDTRVIENYVTDWYLNNSCLPDDGELVAGELQEKEIYINEEKDATVVDDYIKL